MAHASIPPLICPGGTPLGRFTLSVTPPEGGRARGIQTVNRLLPGDIIDYRPLEIDSPKKKNARVALLLVPSDGSKIVVFDPRPADQPATWKAPFRAELASVVWGPDGLDKSKVASLMVKDGELIAQLADYAAKSTETQALIQAITQQRQALDTGESVDAAVAGFAGQFPAVRLDRSQPANVQLGILLHSVNPALSSYDPLAQSPQQQAAQTAGLAAAVGGLFLGDGVGLAATGGSVLVTLHGVLFPHTQFLSALAQPDSPEMAPASSTGLCGANSPIPAHTERAFLWAFRFPDAPPPPLALPATVHLPIGQSVSVPLSVKGSGWKLVPRIQDWRLTADDPGGAGGPVTVPVSVKANTSAKTIELNLSNPALKAGAWKLSANWDWDPLTVAGTVVLHNLSKFQTAHLTPESHDDLTAGAGTLDLDLTGDDFEFVRKVAYKKQGDPFAEAQPLPFHLPKEPANGPETSLKVRMDAKALSAGNYVFLIAQADGKAHETPFTVLPPAPSISGAPMILNTGVNTQTLVLSGSGLDRIEKIEADNPQDAQFALGDAGDGSRRDVTVHLMPGVKAGALLSLRMTVKDFEQPVMAPDVFQVAGKRPTIASVRRSSIDSEDIAIHPDEMGSNSLVSFEMSLLHAPAVSEVDLSCGAGAPSLKIKPGEAKEDLKATQESADMLFLAFLPRAVGPPGCAVMARLITPKDGPSAKFRLGTVVLLPRIALFEIGTEKAGASCWYGTLEGYDLEGITKVGWDEQNGAPVEAIPTPMPGPGNKESLRIAVPWPAPAPHSPLYIWLRGEDTGRLTSTSY